MNRHFKLGYCLTTSLLILSGSVSMAFANNWYVRPNGGNYGAENGTDWTNAFDGFSDVAWGSMACGDTLWVAGGIYTQTLVPAKKCSSGSPLAIRRARSDASEAIAAAGWSSAFDSTVHQTNGAGIVFTGDVDYVIISGQTSAISSEHGWWIDLSTQSAGSGIEFSNGAGADYNRMEYMDLQGPGYITYTGDGRGIDATPFSTATGNTFSHIKIWNWESAIYLCGMHNTTFEYLDMFGVAAVNWSDYHPNGLFTHSADGLTVRYSRFHSDASDRGIGEGIFAEQSGGCANWRIYGNVFYNLSSKAIQITSSIPSVKILNNTFFNVTYSTISIRTDQGGACVSDSETRNNLFFASVAPAACGTQSNNLQISSPNPFISSANNDFHIVATLGASYPRNAGANLSAYFTADPDGVIFGEDGAWDIGAYEYASGAAVPPQPPRGLIAQ